MFYETRTLIGGVLISRFRISIKVKNKEQWRLKILKIDPRRFTLEPRWLTLEPWRLTMESWRDCRQVVADSHLFVEDPDTDSHHSKTKNQDQDSHQNEKTAPDPHQSRHNKVMQIRYTAGRYGIHIYIFVLPYDSLD